MEKHKSYRHPGTGTSRRRFRQLERRDSHVQDRDHFGKLLQGERLAQGMTVAELSSICGLTKDYLYKIERGDAVPPASERIVQIAKAMGVNKDRLLSYANLISEDVEEDIFNNPELICSIIREMTGHGKSGLKYFLGIIKEASFNIKEARLENLLEKEEVLSSL